MLYALFFGMACNDLSHEATTRPGIDSVSRSVLRFGVGLLGARITADADRRAGLEHGADRRRGGGQHDLRRRTGSARRLGLTRSQGILSGGAVAICGASAALAISAVLPREKDGERFTLLAVVGRHRAVDAGDGGLPADRPAARA